MPKSSSLLVRIEQRWPSLADDQIPFGLRFVTALAMLLGFCAIPMLMLAGYSLKNILSFEGVYWTAAAAGLLWWESVTDDHLAMIGFLRRQVSPKPLPMWLQTFGLLVNSLFKFWATGVVAAVIAIVVAATRSRGWQEVEGPLYAFIAVMIGIILFWSVVMRVMVVWFRRKAAQLTSCPEGDREKVARRAMKTAGFSLLLFGSLLQIAPTLMP